MNFNVDNIGANKGGNVVLLARPDGRPISLVSGQAVTAEVVNTVGSGLVMLRITPQSGNSGDTQGALLLAKTNVALNAGDQISLKVIGGDKDISLKFVGFESRAPQPQPVSSAAPESAPALPTTPEQASTTTAPATVQTVAQKVQLLLSELSGARLTSTDFQDLQKLLTNIPSNVKNQFPEFRQLASAMPDIQQLNAQTLKTAVEGSGVFLETNVKQSALQELSNAPDVVMAKDTLNSIVQKAVEAFQYPQTEEHTRSFLSDLTAVTYKGIASLNSDNARDTINMLNQAIEDCLKVVEEDKTMHTGCNCGDVLTSVKQTLDAALSPQTAPSKDAAVTLAGQLSPQRGSGNVPTDVLPSPTQKGVEAARDLTNPQVSLKDEIISLLDPGSPQRGSGNAPTDVLPLPDQKGVEAARDLTNPQVSPKDEIISLLDPGSPQRGSGSVPTNVLPSPTQKGVEAARDLTNPQVSLKDVIITDPGSPQRDGGSVPVDILTLASQKAGNMLLPLNALKDELITLSDQVRSQRTGGDPTATARQKPDELVAAQTAQKDEVIAAQTSPKDKTEAIQSTPKDEHIKTALNVDNDQKALLLKIRNILQDERMSEVLKYSPSKREDLAGAVDKFIKNIEYYQLSSRANDMVYTYLPFLWNELKDGELLFKKNKYHAQKSFTCDINLDLDKLGKLSISVTTADSGFFVSFNAEKDNTKQLILQNKDDLEKRFKAAGLTLKIINVGQKTKLDFAGKNPSGGLDLRI